MKRFRNLSAAQQSAFEQIASGWSGGREFHPRTMQALEAAGLVEGYDAIDTDNGFSFPVTVRLWQVPIPVHIEWCSWCAENFDECPQCTGNGCTGCDYSGMVEKRSEPLTSEAK